MIKNTRNVRDLALAALDEATLDQASGAGLSLSPSRIDMLPPEPSLGGGFDLGGLDAGCPACGYLSSDLPFDLGGDLLGNLRR